MAAEAEFRESSRMTMKTGVNLRRVFLRAFVSFVPGHRQPQRIGAALVELHERPLGQGT